VNSRQGFGLTQAPGKTGGQNHYSQLGQGRAIHWYHVAMTRDHVLLQRRPFLTPIWLTAIGVLVAALVLGLAVWWWGTADCTTVIVIRHAEKALGSVTDPPLTEAGQARAELLARMFGDAKPAGRIDAIYVTPALRNRLTAAPLAARLGLTPVVVSSDSKDLARRALREHEGGRVLVIGHADSVPQIVADLSGNNNIPEMSAAEFGTMYIVTVPRIGNANVLRLSY
jgi:2,3-bisphosphoglycerate-dependent phosphoglycerate mutase